MTSKMSLRTRLLIGSIAAVVAILFTAGFGTFGMLSSNAGLNVSITSTSAVISEKQADMMHDALRADVLHSIVIGPDGPAATKEIARSVAQAASGTRDMSTSIQTVTDAASEAGNAAGQMLGSSSALSNEAKALRQEVEQFLSTIRAM